MEPRPFSPAWQGPVAGRLGQALRPVSRAGCSLGAGMGRPGLSHRDQYHRQAPDFLQSLKCRRGTVITEWNGKSARRPACHVGPGGGRPRPGGRIGRLGLPHLKTGC